MKQLTTLNGKEILLVEVEKGYIKKKSFFINMAGSLRYTEFAQPNGKYPVSKAIQLPEGNWKPLGLASDIAEEIAKTIVEWYADSNDSSYDPQYNETTYFDVFKDYMTGDEGELDTAVESLHSFLKSHHFNPETTVILIKE